MVFDKKVVAHFDKKIARYWEKRTDDSCEESIS